MEQRHILNRVFIQQYRQMRFFFEFFSMSHLRAGVFAPNVKDENWSDEHQRHHQNGNWTHLENNLTPKLSGGTRESERLWNRLKPEFWKIIFFLSNYLDSGAIFGVKFPHVTGSLVGSGGSGGLFGRGSKIFDKIYWALKIEEKFSIKYIEIKKSR